MAHVPARVVVYIRKELLQARAARYAIMVAKGKSRAAREWALATVDPEDRLEFAVYAEQALASYGIRTDDLISDLEDSNE